ncbi:hypothetical protein Agabi119p4_3284 [Agaricus bisporus var. burnettii]|uniref:Uncharacterized protein n=1 Tax=Agaricus bisporus var. burnettii TaxID=192524 RepID=A0A8H7F6X6_AGABI|nr:hypothetical protein Agabi119p4_3284 [Agaricus bisporus var. burnettii]
MNSNDLECERGITILSKCTRNLVNILCIPGHADSGGEVERIRSMRWLSMPMTRTRSMLSKALSRGLRRTGRVSVALRINKTGVGIDHHDSLLNLHGTSLQTSHSHTSHLPITDPFSMLSVQLEHDPYLGLLHLGRIHSGTLSVNDTIWAIDSDSTIIHDANRSTDNLRLDPPNRFALLGQRGHESDIPIHPPMYPQRSLNQRRIKHGRGVLHLGVLLDTLRREGFELCVGGTESECQIVVKDQYAGTVVEKLTLRKGMIANTGRGEGEFGFDGAFHQVVFTISFLSTDVAYKPVFEKAVDEF